MWRVPGVWLPQHSWSSSQLASGCVFVAFDLPHPSPSASYSSERSKFIWTWTIKRKGSLWITWSSESFRYGIPVPGQIGSFGPTLQHATVKKNADIGLPLWCSRPNVNTWRCLLMAVRHTHKIPQVGNNQCNIERQGAVCHLPQECQPPQSIIFTLPKPSSFCQIHEAANWACCAPDLFPHCSGTPQSIPKSR